MPDESLDRILESLARIHVNLEGLRVSLHSASEMNADHEVRLRSMERWRHHLTPLIGVLTFLSGVVCSVFIERNF